MVFFLCLKKICIKNRIKKKKKKKKKEEKEEITPDWVKVGNYAFKRIRERVNSYVNNGWYSKAGQKSISMNPVKKILQDILSGEFNNAKEAKNMYLNNLYGDEEKIRKSGNKTDRKKDMIEVYDQVKKNFITPAPIPDVDYALSYDKSNED